MSNKKQTAVEWLENKFYRVALSEVPTLIEQAKEMEKQQMKEMYLKGIENYDPTFKNK